MKRKIKYVSYDSALGGCCWNSPIYEDLLETYLNNLYFAGHVVFAVTDKKAHPAPIGFTVDE